MLTTSFSTFQTSRVAQAGTSSGWELSWSLQTYMWPEGMPSSASVNSLRLEAEMPPALTAQRRGMDPVDGQLLANLPDLGVKEEG